MFILLALACTAFSEAVAAPEVDALRPVEKTQSAEAKKESEGYLTPMAAGLREQFCRSAIVRTADIQRTLGLSAERVAALEALGASAVEEGMECWLKRAEKVFASMDAEERKQIKQGQASIGALPSEMPDQQAAWKDGLAKLLTSDEVQRLAESKQARRARRVRALGQMMLVEMDEKVAFTASQRARLQPVAERLVDAPAFFPDDPADDHAADFEPATFFAAALAVPENEMLEILDPAQCKRWREASDRKAGEPQQVRGRTPGRVRKNDANREDEEPQTEDFESALSDFLLEKTASLRKRLLAAMTLKVEEAVRLGGLGAEPTRRLQIAVRGATEESLTVWKIKVDERVRGLLGDSVAALGKQAFSRIRETTLDQTGVAAPDEQTVWEAAVLAEMNAEQRAKWRMEIDERHRFKFKSIACLILSEFDRKVSISKEQWDKLDPMIAANTIEYSVEIGNMYSNGHPKWYLDDADKFIPIAAIPEKQITTILSKEQFDQWRRTEECANAMESWSSIQQMHAQRLKRPE